MPTQIDFQSPDPSFVQSIDIMTLLPHRPPFVMVERMEHFDMHSCTSSFTVNKDNIMVSRGILSETAMMENVAQTCALRIGYINCYIFNEQIRLGYIGAIDRAKIYSLPKVGDRVETTIEVLAELADYLMVHATVKTHNRILLETDVRLAV